jgi:hypothetical protein
MTTIEHAEWVAFSEACARHGLDPGAFELSAVENAGSRPGPLSRTVSVKRRTVTRCYAGGPGSDWTAEFADDLADGIWSEAHPSQH